MRKFILLTIALVWGLGYIMGQGNLTPSEVLSRTVTKISNAKGIEANFKIYNSGYSGGGTMKAMGSKFSVALPDVEIWYNGKDLYTYNKRTQETTIVEPTPEELAESNPLAYVTTASKNYVVKYSTVKKEGKYVLDLTPKTKGEIKRITVTINKTSFSPEKIVVEPSNGNPITADISAFKTAQSLSASEFEYPKSKYPKVEIVDLR